MTHGGVPPHRLYRTAVTVGAAMVSSVFLYGIVGVLVGVRPSVAPSEALRMTFYGLAGVLLGPLVALKSAGLRRAFVRRAPDGGPDERAKRLFGLEVAGFALCEAPAVLGLVLYVLTGEIADFYRLAGYSLALFLVFFPRYRQWQEAMR